MGPRSVTAAPSRRATHDIVFVVVVRRTGGLPAAAYVVNIVLESRVLVSAANVCVVHVGGEIIVVFGCHVLKPPLARRAKRGPVHEAHPRTQQRCSGVDKLGVHSAPPWRSDRAELLGTSDERSRQSGFDTVSFRTTRIFRPSPTSSSYHVHDLLTALIARGVNHRGSRRPWGLRNQTTFVESVVRSRLRPALDEGSPVRTVEGRNEAPIGRVIRKNS
jgi:hypothetical protein